jgi:hypothetical protein
MVIVTVIIVLVMVVRVLVVVVLLVPLFLTRGRTNDGPFLYDATDDCNDQGNPDKLRETHGCLLPLVLPWSQVDRRAAPAEVDQ